MDSILNCFNCNLNEDAIEESSIKNLTRLEQNFDDISEKLSVGQTSIDEQLTAFLRTTNEIQKSIEKIKSQICSFDKNNEVESINLFGQLNDNKLVNDNCNKIKNLQTYEQISDYENNFYTLLRT
jgi:hypothetical protein